MRLKYPFKYKKKGEVKSRSELLTLLSEACEIEHGLACSYLYSAFSFKQEVNENITAEHLQHIRKWASQVFFVASQEMLHLSQVWNLLKAIGGTPYYFRPNFPQSNKYYPFHIPLKLEPFSLEALQRFLLYELPSDHKDEKGNYIDEKEYSRKHFGFFSEDNYSYQTVGELYELIRDGFNTIDEEVLFIGNPDMQTTSEEIDFKEIIKVMDRKSAIASIDMITEQGEGNNADRDDCHFGIFKNIQRDYKSFLTLNADFQPARNIISNPIVFNKGNYASEPGTLIVNPKSREVADIFDDIYNLMLHSLQYCFSNTINDKAFNKKVAGFAIQIMVRVLKPLGELLTRLPAFMDPDLKKAGAAFGISRHVTFPNSNEIAKQLVIERAREILKRLQNQDSGQIPFHLTDVINQMQHDA